ncbi:MAG: 4-hydroxy-tetrahydrodipicolinate reductase [Phycisphaerae bacterium]|nr:4-hydroxy-tetrahydrodipicolinate reductase [Phycisphaerae bacterium]
MAAKLVVVGAGGRMGQRLVTLAQETDGLTLVGAVDVGGHPKQGTEVSPGVTLSDQFPETADMVIDFSLPEGTDKTLAFCAAQNAGLVLGTTGLSDAQKDALRALSRQVPVAQATNMSVGMNTLFATVGKIAKMLGEDYDIEIVEQHHRFKKDAPSGTALSLAEAICSDTGRDMSRDLVHGRDGKEALRKKGTLGMHAVRAGDIVGIHSVIYSTLGETITINHTAHSRDTFVRGALRAAQWLIGKSPGLYSLRDVLGIE